MSASKILFFLCLSFIAGIFLESIIKIPQIFVCGIFVVTVLIIFVSTIRLFLCSQEHWNRLLVFGFCLISLALGILRVQITEFNIANDKLSQFNGKGKVVFTGVILSEPDLRDTYQKLKVRVADSTVLITTKRYPEYKYLDKVNIIGKLETPGEIEDGVFSGSYRNYLMKDGIYSVMNFPDVKVIGSIKPSLLQRTYSLILFSKQKIRESIRYNFYPPQSSILEGTILGDNGAMSNDLKKQLNITGLRHVIAVSGTHVVILSEIIMSLLLAVGFSRGKAFYFAIFFICFYIILTGLPPSGVRAGIMGGLFLLAQKIGRQSAGSRIIVTACTVMLIINPLLLFYDVGFQLSFLAVLGLIYLEPFIKLLIKKITKEKAPNLVTIISTTISAQIFTLPVMVYNFGNVSFVSPITNFLVLPIVYWLMVFGFLVAICGVFSNVIGFILFIPCWILLSYFVKIIDIFSQPWMARSVTSVSWVWVFVAYLIISFVVSFLHKKYSQKFI